MDYKMYLKKFIQLSSFITLTATSMSALAQTDSAHGSYVHGFLAI